MSIGVAVHVGLNNLSETWYGQRATLRGAENDARAMMRIATAKGFQPKPFLGDDAKARTVRPAILAVARELFSGDSLLLTFAGHGWPVKDTSGDEPSGMDQTWCLFERLVIDDEIYFCLSKFRAGVRILVISDSCNSGSVIEIERPEAPQDTSAAGSTVAHRNRQLPTSAHRSLVRKRRAIYNGVPQKRDPVLASVILLAACQDQQKALDGFPDGRFTAALLRVWRDGSFQGSLREFFEAIRDGMPSDQTPNWYPLGEPNSTFEGSPPFSL